jgi:homoserine kinase type II
VAVYTPLAQKEIESFLARYSVGHLVSYKGIAEGSENTNYLIMTEQGSLHHRYILTIFEQRVKPDDLPFFLGLTEWLADRGIHCPRPVKGRDGNNVYKLKGKAAALIYFIEGHSTSMVTSAHMQLTGKLVAQLHLAAEDFPMIRRNPLSLEGWHSLFVAMRGYADTLYAGLEKLISDELAYLNAHWPRRLPSGVIHADLFPDNVFFLEDAHGTKLSGVLDFYFASNDFWMYDWRSA